MSSPSFLRYNTSTNEWHTSWGAGRKQRTRAAFRSPINVKAPLAQQHGYVAWPSAELSFEIIDPGTRTAAKIALRRKSEGSFLTVGGLRQGCWWPNTLLLCMA